MMTDCRNGIHIRSRKLERHERWRTKIVCTRDERIGYTPSRVAAGGRKEIMIASAWSTSSARKKNLRGARTDMLMAAPRITKRENDTDLSEIAASSRIGQERCIDRHFIKHAKAVAMHGTPCTSIHRKKSARLIEHRTRVGDHRRKF